VEEKIGRDGRNRKERGDSQPPNSKTAWSGVGYKKEFGCESKQTGEQGTFGIGMVRNRVCIQITQCVDLVLDL